MRADHRKLLTEALAYLAELADPQWTEPLRAGGPRDIADLATQIRAALAAPAEPLDAEAALAALVARGQVVTNDFQRSLTLTNLFDACTILREHGHVPDAVLVSPRLTFTAESMLRRAEWDGPPLHVLRCDWLREPHTWYVTAVGAGVMP